MNSRKNPIPFEDIEDAVKYAAKQGRGVWAEVWTNDPLFHLYYVYPGGRVIHYSS